MFDSRTKFNVQIKNISTNEDTEGQPLSFGEWLKLNLSDEKAKDLAVTILKEIDDIDQERKEDEEKIKTYRNQYDGILEETSLPFPGSFNCNTPITPKYTDACVAQTEEAFDDVDPRWIIEAHPTPDKQEELSRKSQETTLDFYTDHGIDDTSAWTRIYHDAFLLGTGWCGMIYDRDLERVREKKTYSSLRDFQNDFPDDWQKYKGFISKLEKGEDIDVVVEYDQEVYRGPKPEHYEWEDIYVPLGTNGLEGMRKVHIIARRIWMTWNDIYVQENKGDYRAGVSEALKYDIDSSDSTKLKYNPDYIFKKYETFEVIYLTDIDNDGFLERCIFNIDKEHQLMLRDIRYPYNHNRPYIIPYYIKRTKKGIYGDGFGSMLQDTNIAANATLNQVLNAAVIANSLSLKVRTGSDAVRALYEHRWYPGSVLELQDPQNDVGQFVFGTPNLASLISLFAILERFGQDISGIVNYQLGQESHEDPDAPASKTIALMRKAEIKLRRYIKSLKRSNNEAGHQALRLIYQFTPKERLSEILGVREAEIDGIFNLPLKAITQSSGFALEKVFAKRDNMQFAGMLMKDPIIIQDAEKRIVLYDIIAQDWGSNWDKKLRRVLGDMTPENIEKTEQMREKMNKLKQRATQLAQQGVPREQIMSQLQSEFGGENAGAAPEGLIGTEPIQEVHGR